MAKKSPGSCHALDRTRMQVPNWQRTAAAATAGATIDGIVPKTVYGQQATELAAWSWLTASDGETAADDQQFQ